ncbi:NAD synthetase [Lacticaseibacillus pantheris DSM 15945 = JCM 12539 = NBRC 106106]|jgi:NAD+ synthase|uniref:NH(3)-dependent NAD(+) synthetase n=1 Tax=Lacticaseibacillus pantheris DSM 15945 = JCM 12539 = NBRC 106106 TaxID=1423783 RepID=A0A0R1U4Y7_9LACO|nr:ammonia-dependent NAD(+) synthetase [Lacticaseibacillus pantheris]KRL86506.1 NAD synthetase [Lacticaseibacillus pantheris DSM 15945 = JCM 12539 = NBRC 106106]
MRTLQKKIITALHAVPSIDPEKEIRTRVDFLKDYMKANSFLKTYVLGISGGQDSSLAGTLAEHAVTELRAETGDDSYQFIAVRLPYGEQADEADAMQSIEFMQADQTMRVNIKSSVDAMEQAVVANGIEISDFNKGNIKARARMIAQYAIAGQTHGVVIGTDHAAEAVTGFYTKFGDGGADLTPLTGLNKSQGASMLKALGAPAHLYEKAPTADLEDNRPALADEVALGVTYRNIDDYLEGKEVDDAVAEKIEAWYLKTEHKRHLPATVFDEFWK